MSHKEIKMFLKTQITFFIKHCLQKIVFVKIIPYEEQMKMEEPDKKYHGQKERLLTLIFNWTRLHTGIYVKY